MNLGRAGSTVSAAAVMLLLIGCGGTEYRVPSGGMLPTIKVGSIVTVDLYAYRIRKPALGDIVIFHPPANYLLGCLNPREGGTGGRGEKPCGVARKERSSEIFIKRIVGLPGDRIAIRNGHVYRNGVREKDPYVAPCRGGLFCDFPLAITVPRGDYYVMGDNRGASDDSRFWGPVHKSWIIGKVIGR